MSVPFSFQVGTHGETSAEIHRAGDPSLSATLVLAHGAGAPQTHSFFVDMASRLTRRGIDVVTFNFLYAETGRKMPDRMELLEATYRAAIANVRAREGLATARLFLGGKSMGGRVATHLAAADEGLVFDGLVLLGYPLHPAKKNEPRRLEFLDVLGPMLVVQGTRDDLGTAAEMKRMTRNLPNTKLVVVEGGDHSLQLPRRQGADAQERALEAVADAIRAFIAPKVRAKKRRT